MGLGNVSVNYCVQKEGSKLEFLVWQGGRKVQGQLNSKARLWLRKQELLGSGCDERRGFNLQYQG